MLAVENMCGGAGVVFRRLIISKTAGLAEKNLH